MLGLSTADIVAFERAWHQRAAKPVLRDPYARHLCGPLLGFALRFPPLDRLLCGTLLRRIMPASMVVVARARYAEQLLERAIEEEGVDQYVIVGAGMDSFAFRRPDLAERIRVFEVDHPREQRKKLDRIRRSQLPLPPAQHFISADLSAVPVADALAASPFDPSRPTFFSLLGVTYYLSLGALAETARSLALKSPAGTLIVVDYLLDEASCDPCDRAVREALLALVRECGEPMLNSCSLRQVEALMAGEGFELVENFALVDLEPALRTELGDLLFPIPDIFGLGAFRVSESDGLRPC